MSPKKKKWPSIALAIVLIAWGLLAIATGATGSKFANAQGPHIQIAGAVMLIIGACGLFRARASKNEKQA
jgi:hypothetical protein